MTVETLNNQETKGQEIAHQKWFEATMKVSQLISYAKIGDNEEFIRQFEDGFITASEMLTHIVVATPLRLDLAMAFLELQEAEHLKSIWCPKKKRTKRSA